MKRPPAETDNAFMWECLALAQRGAGLVSPNPMVGAVIVRNGKVIARGAHKLFGGPHAEVNAVSAARGSVEGATLYVNLEPCNFFGKTPPCTRLIIEAGFSRVVVGSLDPNPRVRGRGVRELRRAGITVDVGVLEQECRKLNESFEKFITTGLPFVTLKIAQTLDGKIADGSGDSRWISGKSSRVIVHALRARADAVLVGAGTIRKDNPRLTVRHVRGRNPIRVVLDGRLSAPARAKVFNVRSAPTFLFTSGREINRNKSKIGLIAGRGVEVIGLEQSRTGVIPLRKVLRELARRGIASVMVEGGAAIFGEFIREGLADKLLIFQAPRILGNGRETFDGLSHTSIARSVRLGRVSSRPVGEDLLIEAYLEKKKINAI